MSESPSLEDRLLKLDVCSISDALDRLGLPGAVSGIGPQTTRKRISGRVITVRLAAGSSPTAASPRHLCTAAIERAKPGEIVLVEQRTGLDAAGWGGILSNAAVLKGIAGVVIEGPARDIDEAADLGFPIFARSRTARTARGRVYEIETGGTVRVGDVTVALGDWLVADSSGVAFIPKDDVQRVLSAAEQIAEREHMMVNAVRSGQAVGEVMGGEYERLLQNRSEKHGTE